METFLLQGTWRSFFHYFWHFWNSSEKIAFLYFFMMIDTSVYECCTLLKNKNSEHIVVISPSASWKMPRCRMVSCMKNSPIWWWFPPLLRVMRTVRIILSRGHSRKQPKGGHIFPNLPTLKFAQFSFTALNSWTFGTVRQSVREIKYAYGFKHRLWNPNSWD